MPIPFNTTYISVVRSTLPVAEDPYDDPSAYPTPDSVVVAARVRAVVEVPTVNTNLTIGPRLVYTARLTCDPIDLREGDTVTESIGRIWVAHGPTYVQAFGISCTEADLRLVESFVE